MISLLLLLSLAFSYSQTDVDITISGEICTLQESKSVDQLFLRCLGQRPVLVKSLQSGVGLSLDSECSNIQESILVNPQFTKNFSRIYFCTENVSQFDLSYSVEIF